MLVLTRDALKGAFEVMNGRRPGGWRAWSAIAVLAGVVAAVLLWPQTVPVSDPAPKPDVTQAAPPSVSLPQPPPLLDREALLDAADRAASLTAAGRPIDEIISTLSGRRFRFIIPFACHPSDDGGPDRVGGWRFDEGSVALRIHVTPEPFPDDREGFWIDTPWLRDPVCPAGANEASRDASAPDRAVAITRMISPDKPRGGRKAGEPYRLTVRIDRDAVPDRDGLRLVLEGRFEATNEAPIACTLLSADRRPQCIYSAPFDRLAITNASGSMTYGEWTE